MIAATREANSWLVQVQDALHCVGYTVVEDVLDAAFLAATRNRMHYVQERIWRELAGSRRDRRKNSSRSNSLSYCARSTARSFPTTVIRTLDGL